MPSPPASDSATEIPTPAAPDANIDSTGTSAVTAEEQAAPAAAGDVLPPILPSFSFADAVLDSILSPGASHGLVASINVSLVCVILVSVLAIAMGGEHAVHGFVLATLATCLLASVNWFIGMQREADAAASARSVAEEGKKTQ